MDKFLKEIKELYKKYPIFLEILNTSNEEYKFFLYLHLNDNIKFIIKLENEKNLLNNKIIFKIKVNPQKNYYSSIVKIYNNNFTTEEIYILNKNIL